MIWYSANCPEEYFPFFLKFNGNILSMWKIILYISTIIAYSLCLILFYSISTENIFLPSISCLLILGILCKTGITAIHTQKGYVTCIGKNSFFKSELISSLGIALFFITIGTFRESNHTWAGIDLLSFGGFVFIFKPLLFSRCLLIITPQAIIINRSVFGKLRIPLTTINDITILTTEVLFSYNNNDSFVLEYRFSPKDKTRLCIILTTKKIKFFVS